MRDSLTVLAIVVIGVLTTALVGPYLIDWNSHRGLIEHRLSAAAGTKVTVAGLIDLKLLPRPIFKFDRVTIGEPTPGRPHVTIEEVDAEISLTALMRGELQVIDTTLKGPRITLVEATGGGFGLPLPGADDADRVALDHLRIEDGALAVDFADGRHLLLSELDADAEATSLRGPFKATGRFGPANAPLPFHLATGAFDGRKMAVKLRLDGSTLQPTVDLDGTLSSGPPPLPPKAKPGAGFTGPGFDGTTIVTGRLPLADTPATIPWRITAHLTADRDHGAASSLEVRAGVDLRALIATGDAEAVFAPPAPGDGAPTLPSGSVQLHGAQLDLDTLAVVPEGSSPSSPQGADLLGRILGAAGNGTAAVGLPLRLAMTAGFDTVTLDGQTLLGTNLRATAGPEPTLGLRLSSEGADGARLSLEGSFEPGDAAVFRGHVEASSGNLPRTASFLAPSAPALAAWLKGTIPARTVNGAGDVEASRVGATARNVSLQLDGTRLAGTISYTRGVGSDRARLFADLESDNLDLDALPDVSGAAAASQDIDLSLALSAKAVKLAAGSAGTVDAGQMALHLTKSGDDLHLDRLTLAVGGSVIEATADRTGRDARAEAHIRAPQMGALADVLWRLFPMAATAALRDRAAVLSPFDGKVEAEATTSAGDATLAPRRFALDGTASGTHLVASLAPDRPDDGLDVATRPITVAVHADAARATALLQQLGLSSQGVPQSSGISPDLGSPDIVGRHLGGAVLDGTARGSFASGFDATLAAHIGNADLSYTGRARVERGQGHVAISSADLRPVLVAFGLLPSQAIVALDSAALDSAALDSAAPNSGAPNSAAGSQWLASAAIQGDLGWNGPVFALRRLGGRFAGTGVAGDLNLDLTPRRPGQHDERPVLFGQLALDRLPATALLDLAWGSTDNVGTPLDRGAWSEAPFGAPAAALPRSEIGLKIARLPLNGVEEASSVSLVLRAGNGAVTLADATGRLNGGTIGGTVTLRRDTSGASLSGRITWNDIAFDHDGLSARVGGTQDLAGSGATPAALVASLAGTGSLTLAGATLARTDPEALARTIATLDKAQDMTDPDPPAIEVDDVRQALAAQFDRGPLHLGDQTASATLAAGVLRAGPLHAESARWAADADLTFDLRSLDLASTTRLRTREIGTDRKSDVAEVVSTLAGPLGTAPHRDIEAASLVNVIQARAIARDQERIDVVQQDIRERAFFNRRLRVIEADQQSERDRAHEEAEAAAAAKAETDKQRFFENAVKGVDSSTLRARPGGPARTENRSSSPPTGHGLRPARSGDPVDLRPPQSSVQNPPSSQTGPDPSAAGRY